LPRPTLLTLRHWPPLGQWLLLIVLAGGLGQLLKYFAVPAALFIGPMLVAIGFGASGASIRLNRHLFRLGQGCVGLIVAHSMSMAVLLSVLQSWPVMLFSTVLTVLLSAVVGLGMVRYGGFPASTAAWGTAPGAASAMVSMAEDYGADSRIVATMQYVRVVCVVMIGALVSSVLGVGDAPAHLLAPSTPAIDLGQFGLSVVTIVIGVLLGSRIPAGALLLPLLLGGILQVSGLVEITLPDWLLAIAYACLGCYIGLRFDRATIAYVWRRLPVMIGASLILIVLCAASAWLIAWLLSKDYLSVYLATSPGGLDSMAIIALDTHADVGLVLAMQTLRLFGVIVTGAFFARQIIRLSER